MDVLDNDGSWKLLERRSINDRTIICVYNGDASVFSICLFHYCERPNKLSISSPESTYGFLTHMVGNIQTEKEAAEVVGLYLQDMEKDNFWWENGS